MSEFTISINTGILDRSPNPIPIPSPATVDAVMLGYRGESRMDTGYFFVPTAPLTNTPLVIGTDEFVPREGIMTRYGRRLLIDWAQYCSIFCIDNKEHERTPHYYRLEAKGLINPTQLKYDPKMGF